MIIGQRHLFQLQVSTRNIQQFNIRFLFFIIIIIIIVINMQHRDKPASVGTGAKTRATAGAAACFHSSSNNNPRVGKTPARTTVATHLANTPPQPQQQPPPPQQQQQQQEGSAPSGPTGQGYYHLAGKLYILSIILSGNKI